MNKEVLNIKKIGYEYDPELDEAVIGDGEYVVVLGKSGSGKTRFLDKVCSELKAKGMRVGYVLQNVGAQIVTDKVWHELSFELENLGTNVDVMKLRVAEMTNYFGLQEWFYKDVSTLSGGQKQLLNLASVMTSIPQVLILDEPTSQLDPIAASNFLATIKKINVELGITVILTEHRLENIFSESDKCIFLDEGKITAFGTPRKIAESFFEENRELLEMLPAPMRIFYGLKGKASITAACPLTVRDGRKWLGEYLDSAEKNPSWHAENSKEENSKAKICLKAKKLYFRYEKNGRDILNNLELELPENKIFSVVGGNGSGKSTLLKVLCGAKKAYSGKLECSSKIVMLPQEPRSLFTKNTVREELSEICGDKKTLDEVIEICELAKILEIHPFDISGGECQKLAIAKLLLLEPKILLLDEPTKGMDNVYKKKLASILKSLTKKNITVLMVSHDLEFCAYCSDFVGMFFDGQISSILAPDQFFSKNNFYTTSANRMCREYFPLAVTSDSVISSLNSDMSTCNKE